MAEKPETASSKKEGSHAGKARMIPFGNPAKGKSHFKDSKGSTANGIKKHVVTEGSKRILLVAEIRGQFSMLNSLIDDVSADCVISCGNFGFFDEESAATVPEHRLPNSARPQTARTTAKTWTKGDACGEFSSLVSGAIKLHVPVYAIYGSFEDLGVVAKIRAGIYNVENLFLLDENHSFLINNTLRVFGLGGGYEAHRLFDYGGGCVDGIGGDGGRMWPTAIQIGTLIDHAAKVFNPSETRLFVSFSPVISDGFLTQLAIQLQAHIVASKCSVSCDVNFFECSIHSVTDIKTRIEESALEIQNIWQLVQNEVTDQCDDNQWNFIERALKLVDVEATEAYLRNTWHFGVANIRRNSTTVLIQSNTTVGLETRHPGIDVRRLYDEPHTESQKPKDEDGKKKSFNG